MLRFSKGAIAYLEWGVGVAYKNEIDLWTDKKSFFTDKIFSKPENYQPVYRIRDNNGNETFQNGQKSEQFIEMFRDYYDMFSSFNQISNEFENILLRAKVMNQIVN